MTTATANVAVTVITGPESLTRLAKRINAKHRAGEKAVKRGLAHFRDAGLLLIQARASVEHGEWMQWMRDRLSFSQQTASAYMRLAKGWDKLPAAGNLTLRDALLLVAEPWERPAGALPEDVEASLDEEMGYAANFLEALSPEARKALLELYRERREEERDARAMQAGEGRRASLVERLIKVIARAAKLLTALGRDNAQALEDVATLESLRRHYEQLEAA